MSYTPDYVNVGSQQDIQGILALIIIVSVLVMAAVAIIKGADPVTILGSFLPMATLVLGFYYGVKSQQ